MRVGSRSDTLECEDWSDQRDCSLLALYLLDGLLDGALLLATGELLGGELADGEGSSLSVDHDAEALHIVEAGAFLVLLHLLGGAGRFELLGEIELLPCLGKGRGAGAAEDRHTEVDEGQSAEGVHAAGEVHTVNEHLLGISPVDSFAIKPNFS